MDCFQFLIGCHMRIKPLLNGEIVLVNFPTQQDMTETFLRFVEYYESPAFTGKIFTFEEFKHWYLQNSQESLKKGYFTYHEDWQAFYLPSHKLEPFYRGDFHPLSEKEKLFLSAFQDRRKDQFCIIGVYGEAKKNILKHEIAHALFGLFPEYKQEVLAIIQQIPTLENEKILQFLADQGGYHPDSYDDETHAYVLEGRGDDLEEAGIDMEKLAHITYMLDLTFKKFAGELFKDEDMLKTI